VHRENVSSRWNESYTGLTEVVESGVGGAADVLASRYAIATTGDSTQLDVLVKVEQLSSLNEYAAVLNYLSGLIFIENVVPARVESNSVVFRLLMRSELVELDRILTGSKMLRPVAVVAGSATNDSPRERIDLIYTYHKL
jgi:hypothetical protein